MVDLIMGTAKLAVAAGLAVLTAGVISPETAAGGSVPCRADGAAGCRPSDLGRWITPAAVDQALAATGEFTATVAAASHRLYGQVTTGTRREPVR